MNTYAYFSLLEAHTQTKTFDDIAVTEAFLTDDTSTSHLQLPGFTFINHNRKGKAGGGIVLYVRAKYQITVLPASDSTYDNTPEYIITELCYKN